MNLDSIFKVIRGIVTLRGSDNNTIGSVGDKLKITADEAQIAELNDHLTKIARQLNIITAHLQYLSTLELDDGDEGDFD